jgi:hypothetical protein
MRPLRVQRLETREVPAGVFTFTDVDGDAVTVRTSKGGNADLAAAGVIHLAPAGNGMQFEELDLSLNAGTFAGTSVTIAATRVGNGDGLVHVGFIDATGGADGDALDLGAVTIDGDLGRIIAGDAATTTPGVALLAAQSLGRFGSSTQAGGVGGLQTNITGALGALRVAGDAVGAFVNVVGGPDAKVGSVFIGGSLLGTGVANSGKVLGDGDIGPVTIGHDLQGGAGSLSGRISTDGSIASVIIGGSIRYGAGNDTGVVNALGNLGPVRVAGDVVGEAPSSGQIRAGGALAALTVGGSLVGGAGDYSGQVLSGGDMGPVKVGGNVRAAGGAETGKVVTGGRLARLTVGGSIIGGAGDQDTVAGQVAQVRAADSIGSIRIGGSLLGGAGDRTAAIETLGTIGAVRIGGDLRGGGGFGSGVVFAVDDLASISVGGSLIGGDASSSGNIKGENVSTVRIGGDVRGGAGGLSGLILVARAGTLVVGGSLVGGNNDGGSDVSDTGRLVGDSAGLIRIAGDVRGGSLTGAGNLSSSGSIGVGHVGRLEIGGSVVAGTDTGLGELRFSGAIRGTDFGEFVVRGSLIGNRVGDGQDVRIQARGAMPLGGTTDSAFKSIVIGGRVEYARILAGYSGGTGVGGDGGVNADAQIGSVTVGGDWIASDLAAGATDGGDGFGNFNDDPLSGMTVKDFDLVVSRIGSIVIKGQAMGTIAAVNAADRYGFVAQQIGSLKIGSTVFSLDPGIANDGFDVGVTADLRVREVSLL